MSGLTKTWDVIVVGSGLGGLTTASLLARAGKRVILLEKHSVPGGFTHSFRRRGFEWDVGVHYVGQVSQPGFILRRVFDYITGGMLHWAPMPPVYDRAVIAGDVYDFEAGLEKQIQILIKQFPEEARAIRKYFKLVKSVGSSSAWFFGEKTMPRWLSRSVGFLLRWKFARTSGRTTYETLKTLTSNEKLISALCAQCGDYGLPPKRSSFGIHAIVAEHYINGGSYPSGGAARIHETILSIFKAHEGEIRLKSEVTQIQVKEGKVTGVKLANGEQLVAPIVVSNAGAWNTFMRLLPLDAPRPETLASDLNHVKASTAHACLYIGLNASDLDLKLPLHNLWLYEEYDFDVGYDLVLKGDPKAPFFTYISFPSAKDPAWAEKHPGKATIQVITTCPYHSVQNWESKPWMKRGDDYLAFKEKLAQRLLAKVIEALPQIKNHIEYSELSTPLSTRHFSNYQRGEIYGLEHTPARFKLGWLRPETPIKGLYLTGQDIVTVGVGGALFSGVITATALLKRAIFWNILRNKPL